MSNAIAILSQPFMTPDGNPKSIIIGDPSKLLVTDSVLGVPVYRLQALGIDFEVVASSVTSWGMQQSSDQDGSGFSAAVAAYAAAYPNGVFDARA